MAERPEDLNLPITVVQRIIKEALPDGVVVSKEARQTISRASSVFVLYLTACAVTHANKCKRKTLAVADILNAIEDMEFDSFVQPLNDSLKIRKDTLNSYSKKSNTKSPEKTPSKRGKIAHVEDAEEEMDEDVVDEEDEDINNVDDQVVEINEENNESVSQKNKKRKISKNVDNSNDSNEIKLIDGDDDDDDEDDEN